MTTLASLGDLVNLRQAPPALIGMLRTVTRRVSEEERRSSLTRRVTMIRC